MGRILVVEDDAEMGEGMADAIRAQGHEVLLEERVDTALEVFEGRDIDVIVTDLRLGGSNGLSLCKSVVEKRPDVPVVVITAFGSMETAISAIHAGAYDFITKPVDFDHLQLAIERALRHHELDSEVRRLREAVAHEQRLDEIIGASPSMKKVYELVERVSESEATVLVTGEAGTGKELVARAIHARSSRAEGPFVAINCAAVPPTLLESELFGHANGALTGMSRSRDGLFLQGGGGTLLLDEIGALPIQVQPKLLRAIKERKIRPVGGDVDVSFDTRVLAATNQDLEALVESGGLREDLYYRINVVQICIPPLRARGNDVLLLAQKFVEHFAARLGKPVNGLSTSAAKHLLEYGWPGNVRELESCIERAVTLTAYDLITVDDLPEKVRRHDAPGISEAHADPDQLPTLEDLERRYIQRVLTTVGGNKTRAAKVLGLDRRTLYRKLDRYEGREERGYAASG